jgi:hypothetical protein
MPDLYFFATPRDTYIVLTLDTGVIVEGVPCAWAGRDDAQRLTLPAGTPTQGALLHAECDGHTMFEGRGIVECDATDPYFIYDDIHLQPLPAPPQPPPGPDPNADPTAIIDAVYALQDHDLSTHDGCGEFTEDCCTSLHEQQSADWGHIKKNPGQNQFNGHAVDALMLRWPAGNTPAGIYDIIHDSVAPGATPSFNWKGDPDPALWYYPA